MTRSARWLVTALIGVVVGGVIAACVGDDPSVAPLPSVDGASPLPVAPVAPVASVVDAPAVPPEATIPQVAIGGVHACALTSDGTVYCWGSSRFGQSGLIAPSPIAPTKVAGLPAVRRIALGSASSCAIDRSNRVWCWGLNEAAELGHTGGDVTCRNLAGVDFPCNPTPTMAVMPDMLDVTLGFAFACGRTTLGAAWCWGNNTNGQTGRPFTAAPVAPDIVGSPLAAGVRQLSAGFGDLAVAVKGDVAVSWGTDYAGALGRTSEGPATCGNGYTCDPTPGPVRLLDGGAALSGVTEVRAGTATAVARLVDGSLVVWGSGQYGLLMDGDGTSDDVNHARALAAPALGIPKADAVSLTVTTGCLLSSGDVYCWGLNDRGQVGVNDVASHACGDAGAVHSCVGTPMRVALGAKATQVAAGKENGIALLADGRVAIWGSNAEGQLGHAPGSPDTDAGRVFASTVPVIVPGLPLLQ